jgi:glycylpeptide N-tetradecanoyltransferase
MPVRLVPFLYLHSRKLSYGRYHHRLIDIPKLVDIKFCFVPRSMTLARMIRVNKIPSSFSIAGLRPMEEKDVPQVADLFSRYMRRFGMAPIFNLEETKHQFLSGNGTGAVGDGGPGRRRGQVTWCYVVEVVIFTQIASSHSNIYAFVYQNRGSHEITDFFSFYSLPSTVINSTKNPVLEAAYLFYYASDVAFQDGSEEDGRLKKRIEAVIGDALVVASEAKFDVFNALTLMDNVPVLQDLKVRSLYSFL